MLVTRYFQQDDYSMISSWYERRDMRPPALNDLSPCGIIVETQDGTEAVCALWLYRLEGTPLGMFECLIANPDSTPFRRKIGITSAINEGLERAKSLGINRVVTMPYLDKSIQYFKASGFKTILPERVEVYMKEVN